MNEWIKRLEQYGADIKEALERLDGDEELYLMCLQMLRQDSYYEQLTACGEQRQQAGLCGTEAMDAAHTLKGVAANLGLTPLYKALSDLVEALRAEEEERAQKYYLMVVEEWGKVLELFP